VLSITKVYIYGLGEGFLVVNIKATEKKAPLFCQPDKRALSREDYVDIVDHQIKERSKSTDLSAARGNVDSCIAHRGTTGNVPCTGE
jgi:hypothetical protein